MVVIAPSLAVGFSTVSTAVLTKLHIEQCSAVQVDGFLDCMSLTGLRLALPLAWMTSICILLTFVMKLVFLALALNFPFLIRFTASFTGVLSGATRRGLRDSLIMSISACIPVAKARASTSHGDHFLQCSGSLTEWKQTGLRWPSITAYSTWPMPGVFCALSGTNRSWSCGDGR